MLTHSFTIIFSEIKTDMDSAANKLYETGCDDALFSYSDQRGRGVYHLDFDREANTLRDAVTSAIHDVLKSNVAKTISLQVPKQAYFPSIDETIRDALIRRGWGFDTEIEENSSGEVHAFLHPKTKKAFTLTEAIYAQEEIEGL